MNENEYNPIRQLFGLVVVGLVSGALVAGLVLSYQKEKTTYVTNTVASASPVNTTFNTAKFAGIVSVPATGTATSSSILNSDSNDRYVTNVRVGCASIGTSLTAYSGAALATLTLTVGTTSSSAPANVSLWSTVAKFVVPTSSPAFVLSTTTTPVAAGGAGAGTATTTMALVWNAGTYMTFAWNATNTAACTVGVDYLGS